MSNLLKSRYFYILVVCVALVISYLLFDLKGLFGAAALALGLTKRKSEILTKDEPLKQKSDELKNDLKELDKKKKEVKSDNKQLTEKETVDYWKDQ